MSDVDFEQEDGIEAIAVVGMAGRFPGSANLEAFWANLREGREGVTFFSQDELRELGVAESSLADPYFVPAAPVLEGVDLFDAGFFGYSPREAQMLDPQQRLFLETAHAAVESAGYDAARYSGSIGVYGGTSMSTYMLFNVLTHPRFAGPENEFPAMIGNDKDFLASRVAYHLNLRGPAIDVQTGCSSSLVATHLACDALLAYQCDMALAGGVSVNVPQRTGYFYEEGGITSPDGHCRAFDAQGGGTLFGSGVGVVVLKRLEDALADGDSIWAVIKSSAINNDGSSKVGFTAPGMDGQTEVISRALSLADVSPATIDYVEAHGTGTALGDPIEVGALTGAYRAETEARGYCALGSVKSNIGHLDAAAGVAGLIKTCLALQHGQIPPTLHVQEANPKLELETSPFYLNDQLRPWPQKDRPRRAAVSSFGIGGTNAHAILEEAPDRAPSDTPRRRHHLLLLSAKTEAALRDMEANLKGYLETHPDVDLADVAYTLQVGRRRHECRSVLVAENTAQAVEGLSGHDPNALHRIFEEGQGQRCVFMFPGGGAQHLAMGADLYEGEAVFKEAIDACAALLRSQLDEDLVRFLYEEEGADRQARIQGTVMALPALFAVEYACAKLLMSWGLKPEAMIGHSMGEYVAACLAGVFSLEDALAVVVLRGKLFSELPQGGMSSVPLSAEEIRPLLGERLVLAAVNGPSEVVVSGPVEALDAFDQDIKARGIESRRLKIDVAAHSPMLDLILPRFRAFVENLSLNPPSLPLIANVTGTWMDADQACDPDYWVRHLRQTVLFDAGMSTLQQEPDFVFLEVGPGRALTSLTKSRVERDQHHRFLASMRHPMDGVADDLHLMTALGRLWAAGLDIDWPAFYDGERRHRVAVPTYAFQRLRYWIEPGEGRTAGVSEGDKLTDIDRWLKEPGWQRSPQPSRLVEAEISGTWLIFDDGRLGHDLMQRLNELGADCVAVTMGHSFSAGATFSLRPGIRADYDAMMRHLEADGRIPSRVLHCWGMVDDGADFVTTTDRCYHSLLFLHQALDAYGQTDPLAIHVFASGLFEVESGDTVRPDVAPLLGPCTVIPQEHHHIRMQVVDLDAPRGGRRMRRVEDLLAWALDEDAAPFGAWRGPYPWTPTYLPVALRESERESAFAVHGCYLITGGLGGVGLLLAQHLATTCKARLVLTSRRGLPPRQDWDPIADDDPLAAKIQAVRDLESAGAEVLVVAADVTDLAAMEDVVAEAEGRFGRLHGAIHAAGIAGAETLKTSLELDRETSAAMFAAKVEGCRVLHRVFEGRDLDFVILLSSNVTALGGLGATAYTAANCFLDAFAATWPSQETRWISTNWDGWLLQEEPSENLIRTSIDHLAMTPAESTAVFSRIVAAARGHRILVSTSDFDSRYDLWIRRRGVQATSADEAAAPRQLTTVIVPPENELQETLVSLWQEQLGIDALGIHDNFFDLGGSSLIALKLVGRLEKVLHIKVPVVSLFEAPTVASLATLLGDRQAEEATPEVEESRGQRRRERRGKRRKRTSEVHH